MPRTSRIITSDFPYHITQRGNYRQVVFEEDQDYLKYLALIKEYGERYGLKLWAYCLMSNHVHFITVPSYKDSLSMAFKQAHMRYSQYFNEKKKQSGHLWQGRFFSCCLDEPHLFAAVSYVENNPVRAGFVEKAEDYCWSSAASHINKENNSILSDDLPLLLLIPNWRKFLCERNEEKIINQIRNCTQSGRHELGQMVS